MFREFSDLSLNLAKALPFLHCVRIFISPFLFVIPIARGRQKVCFFEMSISLEIHKNFKIHKNITKNSVDIKDISLI